MTTDEYEKLIVSKVDKLPPMPETIRELRALYKNPNSNLAEVSEIIKTDPALVANVLHIVNSAYYGLHREVNSVEEAVTFIGFEPVINFLASNFTTTVIKKHFSDVPDLKEYFVHSKDVSIAAMLLAKEAGKSRSEQSLIETAALLHDIGRLIIMVVGKHESELLSSSWNYQDDMVIREKQVFGIDHCEIGKDITEKWEFSEEMATIIERHHTPFEGEYCENAAFVMVAHFISMPEITDAFLITLYPEENLDMMGLTNESLLKVKREFIEMKSML